MEAGGARPNHNSMQVSGADFAVLPSTFYQSHETRLVKSLNTSSPLFALLLMLQLQHTQYYVGNNSSVKYVKPILYLDYSKFS